MHSWFIAAPTAGQKGGITTWWIAVPILVVFLAVFAWKMFGGGRK